MRHFSWLLLTLTVLACAFPAMADELDKPDAAEVALSTEHPIQVERAPSEADAAYYNRLFLQCGSWFPQYEHLKDASRDELIKLGLPALTHLIPTWLASDNVRHRVTMEQIIDGVGIESVPLLLSYVADENPVMRQRIAVALGKFDDPRVLPALHTRLTQESDVLVLSSLIEGIGQRGAGHPELISALTPFGDHKDERLRRNMVLALGNINDPAAIDPLVQALGDPQFGVRFPARDALWKIGMEHKTPMPNDARIESFEGISLLIELQIGLLPFVKNPPDYGFEDPKVDSPEAHIVRAATLFSWQDEWRGQIGLLRGCYRIWLEDHQLGDRLFSWLPASGDPRVFAVFSELQDAQQRQLLREAETE